MTAAVCYGNIGAQFNVYGFIGVVILFKYPSKPAEIGGDIGAVFIGITVVFTCNRAAVAVGSNNNAKLVCGVACLLRFGNIYPCAAFARILVKALPLKV